MALRQCWPTIKKEFFDKNEYSWVKVNDRSGGFPIKFQVLGWRHIKVFYLLGTNMLPYRIHGVLPTDYQFRRRVKVTFFHLNNERAAMKTQHFVSI